MQNRRRTITVIIGTIGVILLTLVRIGVGTALPADPSPPPLPVETKEEELPLTAEEILDLAKDMDFDIIHSHRNDWLPPKDRLAEVLKPGQLPTAIALGKALFWDQQLGSDGQACASCHFHAGADNRKRNQLSGGAPDDAGTAGKLDRTRSGRTAGPTYTLTAEDFPFHAIKDSNLVSSEVLFDSDDVVGSQGSACQATNHVRATTGRNTPTTINAIFQFRSFWDGRANNRFNGVSPFGLRERADSNPNLTPGTSTGRHQLLRAFNETDETTGRLHTVVRATSLDLPNAALASQAVGPPVNSMEMGCLTWPQLGHKMIAHIPRPLHGQSVALTDSVLGPYRHPINGLKVRYRELIQQVFQESWWRDPRHPKALKQDQYPLIENNFSMFFGIAVMLYESTLISDRSPFDHHLAALAHKPGGVPLSGEAALGFTVFMTRGDCVACHRGPDLTASGFDSIKASKKMREQVELMVMHKDRDSQTAMYDSGFYNLGVRPTREDLGNGRNDPYGFPLSFTKQYLPHIKTGQSTIDPFTVDPCGFAITPCEPITNPDSIHVAVKGSFKTSGLRNVELTGPYMHHGGMATLEQVVDFYNRGGDFQNREQSPDIKPLGLSPVEKTALVAFLKSLTDERVRCERAPFDHPSLQIPDGYRQLADGTYHELRMTLPAVGKGGRPAHNLACLASFEEQLRTSKEKGGQL